MATLRSYNQTNIRNEGASKVITFNGAVERPGFSGVVSSVSWGNASTMVALRQLFGCKLDEVIVAIEITNDGIKAKFERDLTSRTSPLPVCSFWHGAFVGIAPTG